MLPSLAIVENVALDSASLPVPFPFPFPFPVPFPFTFGRSGEGDLDLVSLAEEVAVEELVA